MDEEVVYVVDKIVFSGKNQVVSFPIRAFLDPKEAEAFALESQKNWSTFESDVLKFLQARVCFAVRHIPLQR